MLFEFWGYNLKPVLIWATATKVELNLQVFCLIALTSGRARPCFLRLLDEGYLRGIGYPGQEGFTPQACAFCSWPTPQNFLVGQGSFDSDIVGSLRMAQTFY